MPLHARQLFRILSTNQLQLLERSFANPMALILPKSYVGQTHAPAPVALTAQSDGFLVRPVTHSKSNLFVQICIATFMVTQVFVGLLRKAKGLTLHVHAGTRHAGGQCLR